VKTIELYLAEEVCRQYQKSQNIVTPASIIAQARVILKLKEKVNYGKCNHRS
jgi:hypothetical protein